VQTNATKAFLGAWTVWFLHQVFRLTTDYVWTKPNAVYYEYSAALGGPVLVGFGGWLAWRLYQRAYLSTAIWFFVICAILFWKFWISGIVFSMHDSLGGHTFSEAIAQWWSRTISSFGSALGSLLPLPLLAVSIACWPFYCRKRRIETIDYPA
jgi:hypothetical protein